MGDSMKAKSPLGRLWKAHVTIHACTEVKYDSHCLRAPDVGWLWCQIHDVAEQRATNSGTTKSKTHARPGVGLYNVSSVRRSRYSLYEVSLTVGTHVVISRLFRRMPRTDTRKFYKLMRRTWSLKPGRDYKKIPRSSQRKMCVF